MPCCRRPDPTSAINIVLSGGMVPATHTAPSALVMGGYASTLNDQQIAEVVSFIQTSWGNHGSAATAAQVAKLRKNGRAGPGHDGGVIRAGTQRHCARAAAPSAPMMMKQ